MSVQYFNECEYDIIYEVKWTANESLCSKSLFSPLAKLN